jgi:gamma-glutamyltranspeptidase / glutathione hydrolase
VGAAPQETWSIRKNVVNASGGLVAAQHVGAATVGADVLAAGGNAVDATLAAALALGGSSPG